jgi:hypothetical protein
MSVSPFSLRAIMCDRPGTADPCITNRVRRCWVYCGPNCVKLHLAVCLLGAYITDWYHYSCKEETLQTEQTWDITELVLEWDWCALIRRLRHFCSEWQWHWHDTDDITGINFTQWTDSTNCWPTTYSTCRSQFYRGSQCVTTYRATPHL